MAKMVNCMEEVVIVSNGKGDIGKLVALGEGGKLDSSVIPTEVSGNFVGVTATYAAISTTYTSPSDKDLVIPDVQLRELFSSILDLQVEMDNTNKVQLGMATIGRDNIVDKHEETEWKKYMSNLRSLGGALFSVAFAPIQKEKSPVLAHRRFEY